MRDYVKSRPAKVGEKLRTQHFFHPGYANFDGADVLQPVQDRDNPGFVLHVADRRDRMASGSADLIGDDRECLGRAPRHRDRKALPCKAPGRGSAQSSARADANDSGNGFVYGHSINHCLVPKP